MKKILLVLAVCFTIIFCACGSVASAVSTQQASSSTAVEPEKGSNSNRKEEQGSNNKQNKSSTSFTNKFGTPTTICAHTGCKNYIATSGDTNCCVTHSNKCLDCGKYIDEDAMYCMDCLTKASKKSDSGSYGSSKNSNSNKGEGGYEMPNESDESFSDYVQRVDPELYDELFSN